MRDQDPWIASFGLVAMGDLLLQDRMHDVIEIDPDPVATSPTAPELRPLSFFWRFFIYGMIGLCTEVVFTAVHDSLWQRFDPRLLGQTYLWMHPIWATALYGVELLSPRLKARRLGWFVRALFYAAGAFAVEYSTGWILRQIVGQAPWSYAGQFSNIDGLIRLDFVGGWAMAGLVSERITEAVRRVRTC